MGNGRTNMSHLQNLPASSAAEQQLLKMQISIDQYKNDCRQAELERDMLVSAIGMLRAKFHDIGRTSPEIGVKLVCSAMVIDCDNALRSFNSEPLKLIFKK